MLSKTLHAGLALGLYASLGLAQADECTPHDDHWHCPPGVPEPTTPPGQVEPTPTTTAGPTPAESTCL